MTLDILQTRLDKALQKLCKWRGFFAGWQLGTRAKGDPECEAVRDHRELSLLMRVELNALSCLLISKGLITQEEWITYLTQEAKSLDASYEERFPGVKATDIGLELNPQVIAEKGTMKGWKP